MKKPSTVLTRPDSYVKNGMNDCRHLYNRQEKHEKRHRKTRSQALRFRKQARNPAGKDGGSI